MRSPEGAYAEKHLPVSVGTAYALTARDRDEILPEPSGVDENGVSNRQARVVRLRARLSRYWFAHNIQKPTREELEDVQPRAELPAGQERQ
jgi:ubiquinol-cytochrome c reductase cytochrome b subunit